ncbi:hypothetical protein J4464_06845 [Candidatus Woesearchaeota archaeon]|nr:hypothetical protein [Candidatus Woesearchaeota archaeon]
MNLYSKLFLFGQFGCTTIPATEPTGQAMMDSDKCSSWVRNYFRPFTNEDLLDLVEDYPNNPHIQRLKEEGQPKTGPGIVEQAYCELAARHKGIRLAAPFYRDDAHNTEVDALDELIGGVSGFKHRGLTAMDNFTGTTVTAAGIAWIVCCGMLKGLDGMLPELGSFEPAFHWVQNYAPVFFTLSLAPVYGMLTHMFRRHVSPDALVRARTLDDHFGQVY